jgi:hypothetical protein
MNRGMRDRAVYSDGHIRSRLIKSKLAVRKIVVPVPITASELDTVERILARFVALTYVADRPNLFTAETEEKPVVSILSSSAVP